MESIGTLTPQALVPQVKRALELASDKTRRLEQRWHVSDGAPVFTVSGRYTARSWTQWTQGIQSGNSPVVPY